MPVPTSYSEYSLAEYMYALLGDTAQVIGWNWPDSHVPPMLENAVIETLIAYGVGTIEEASDIVKLRTLAQVEAWRAAAAQVAGDYKFSDIDGRTHERQQVYDHCIKQMQAADAVAVAMYGALPTAVPASASGRIALDVPRSMRLCRSAR